MIRIALAVVAAVGLTFAADAQVGPLCQTPDGTLVVCYSGHGGGSQVGPLCQTPDGTLVVCYSAHGGGSQVGPLCQTPDGTLVVCPFRRG
jgi:hypothetical protein